MKDQPVVVDWLRSLTATGQRRVATFTVIGLVLAFRAAYFLVAINGRAWAYDFSAYWLAAVRIVTHQPLYSAAQLVGPFPPQERFAYLYPPFLAVVLSPLVSVFDSYAAAMWIWAGLELAVFVIAVTLLARHHRLPLASVLVLLALTLCLPQVALELVLGNVHLILAGLLLAAWIGIDSDSHRGRAGAGVAIGLATVIKIFPGVLIVWLILTRRFDAAVVAIATSLACLVLTVPVVGLQSWYDSVIMLAHITPPVESFSSIAPTTILSDLVGLGPARIVLVGTCLIAMAWAVTRKSTAVGYSTATMVAIVAVPTLYQHSLVLVVAPWMILAVTTNSFWTPVLSYLAMFVGGEAALAGLRPVVNRTIAFFGLLSPLLMLVSRQRSVGAGETISDVY